MYLRGDFLKKQLIILSLSPICVLTLLQYFAFKKTKIVRAHIGGIEMEARLDKNRRKRKEFQERLEEMRQEREMHLEYFIEGKSSLKQYHNMEITQTKSYFDTNA